MALRVEPTPTPVPTNGRCTPMENTPVYYVLSVCRPWGKLSAVKRLIAQMNHRLHVLCVNKLSNSSGFFRSSCHSHV